MIGAQYNKGRWLDAVKEENEEIEHDKSVSAGFI